MRKNYNGLIGSLYTNYIFQGIAAIIISQNLKQLTAYWGASVQEVMLVMSAIGLGRLLILYFAGTISDKVGRKKTILLGMLCYLIFFGGILISKNYIQGFIFALFAGFSNAFLDTGTYPTLVEAYPESKDSSSLSVLNKAFISLGQFLLPFGMRIILTQQLFFGYIFFLCFVILLINLFVMLRQSYPEVIVEQTIVEEIKETTFKPRMKLEGLALIIFGFTSVSTFNIFITWVPTLAERLQLMSEKDSLILISIYSVGSFISVFFTSYLVKKNISSTFLLVACGGLSTIVLLLLTLFPSAFMLMVAAIGVGVFSAGGVWQLALALLLEFFPTRKGRITSYYSLASALSVMIIPYATGYLSELHFISIFWLDIFLTFVGFVCTVVIYIRYKQLQEQTSLLNQEPVKQKQLI